MCMVRCEKESKSPHLREAQGLKAGEAYMKTLSVLSGTKLKGTGSEKLTD